MGTKSDASLFTMSTRRRMALSVSCGTRRLPSLGRVARACCSARSSAEAARLVLPAEHSFLVTHPLLLWVVIPATVSTISFAQLTQSSPKTVLASSGVAVPRPRAAATALASDVLLLALITAPSSLNARAIPSLILASSLLY